MLRVLSYFKLFLIIVCLFIRINTTLELTTTTPAVNKLVARLMIGKVIMILKIEKFIMTLVTEKTSQSKP